MQFQVERSRICRFDQKNLRTAFMEVKTTQKKQYGRIVQFHIATLLPLSEKCSLYTKDIVIWIASQLELADQETIANNF